MRIGNTKRCLIAETVAWPCGSARPRHSFSDHQMGPCLRWAADGGVLPDSRAVAVGQSRLLNNVPYADVDYRQLRLVYV